MPSKTTSHSTMRQPPSETYLESESLDYLARMNVELLSELWVVVDRLAVLEQVLVDNGLIGTGAVDNLKPTKSFQNRLEKLRHIVVGNVLGAPFKNDHTVETLKARGRALAETTPIAQTDGT